MYQQLHFILKEGWNQNRTGMSIKTSWSGSLKRQINKYSSVVVVCSSFTAIASLYPGRVPLVQGLNPQKYCLLLWPLRGPPPFHYISLYLVIMFIAFFKSILMVHVLRSLVITWCQVSFWPPFVFFGCFFSHFLVG